MRPIQRHLRQRWSQRRNSLSEPVQVMDSLRASLVWWQDPLNLSTGVPFVPEEPSWILTTDASLRGWEAFLGGKMVQGLWSKEESNLHINLLELRAVRLPLASLLSKVRGSMVLLRTDTTTVVSYINKQGGTKSPSLCQETELLWNWALSHQVRLRAVHLAGKDNILADAVSRDLVDPHEWLLHQAVAADTFARWGEPIVDLFASAANTKVPKFWFRRDEPQALSSDALSNRWPAGLLYAFPPIPLFPRVIQKLRNKGGLMILIAPHWPRQLWFPDLLNLQLEPALPLPFWDTLLSQNEGRVLHPNPRSLNLHAWILKSET
ncbi:mitochondrial import receptor subunit TOM5 homolog isoform X4 [Latimeria chalumnae]|uniref:mitochondrial import receptor subunit TOM5 homolog isoform X4 n=1 Tax=Latimeria chalumnae TaxID=7897 RepID=UPI00313DFE9D